MGAYLSRPETAKVSENGEGNKLRYGASCMQGWRVSQEVRKYLIYYQILIVP